MNLNFIYCLYQSGSKASAHQNLLEGFIKQTVEYLMLKLQLFGHPMWRADSWEKTDAGKDWRQKEKGAAEDEMIR